MHWKKWYKSELDRWMALNHDANSSPTKNWNGKLKTKLVYVKGNLTEIMGVE